MKKLLILFFVVLLGYSLLPAIVSEYTFASSIGTYTPITDGTVQGTSANDDHSFNAIPIGFDFTFDSNVTSVVSINSTDSLLSVRLLKPVLFPSAMQMRMQAIVFVQY